MTNENQQQLDVPTLVLEAIERCQDYLSPTPLEYSMYLSEQIEGEVWLKLDSMQRTASFKFRGAINKILTLTEEELRKGVISASTGNYALAVAEAMHIRKHRATIYVGKDIESSRLELLRAHGLDLVVFDGDAWGAEKEARRVAEEEDKIYVSPYNDPIVVGGQGTCGYEISRQLPDLDAAFFALNLSFRLRSPPTPRAAEPSTTRRCCSNSKRMEASISFSESKTISST